MLSCNTIEQLNICNNWARRIESEGQGSSGYFTNEYYNAMVKFLQENKYEDILFWDVRLNPISKEIQVVFVHNKYSIKRLYGN